MEAASPNWRNWARSPLARTRRRPRGRTVRRGLDVESRGFHAEGRALESDERYRLVAAAEEDAPVYLEAHAPTAEEWDRVGRVVAPGEA